MTATTIQARIFVDDVPCAVLTIENALTGTLDRPDYLVSLDRFKERDTIVTDLKGYEREGKIRLDLIRDAFAATARAELRRRHCPQCDRDFIDQTRNGSAKRCSRACTIRWSNALRLARRMEAAHVSA